MSTVTLAPQTSIVKKIPMPWKPMIRITWIQHRFMVLGTLGLFGGLAIYMLVTYPAIHSLHALWVTNGCPTRGANLTTCMGVQSRLLGSEINLTAVDIVLHVIPVVVGMFLGAPLIAREFESGTYRFTWTQGMPRALWFALKFILLAVVVVVAACLVGLFATSYSVPYNAVGLMSRWQAGEFDVTGLTLGAWTLFALALGVFFGSLTKRIVSAMAVAFAAAGAVIIAAYWKLDFQLLALGAKVMKTVPSGSGYGPLNQFAQPGISKAPLGSCLVKGWYTNSKGQVLSTHAEKLLTRTQSFEDGKTQGAWLTQHHYSYWVSYQPGNRFWMFEGVESVILLALALVLVWGTSLLIRRRA